MLACGWKRLRGAIGCWLAVCAISAAAASGTEPTNIATPEAAEASGTDRSWSPDAAPTRRDGDLPPLASIESGLIAAQASADALHLGQWIEHHSDVGALPFAIVDKKQARLHVFDDRRNLVGSSVVLTGAMPGDESLPGVGQRAQSARLGRHERTTPAGRFASEPGHNLQGEDIVWFDYDAALAIHRLRPGASHASRAQRLASATPDDNRASLGCVVVPVEFYERVVRPWLGVRRGVIYVLPDKLAVQAWWPTGARQATRIADGS